MYARTFTGVDLGIEVRGAPKEGKGSGGRLEAPNSGFMTSLSLFEISINKSQRTFLFIFEVRDIIKIMIKFRYLFVLLLICLITIDHTESSARGGRRGRPRRPDRRRPNTPRPPQRPRPTLRPRLTVRPGSIERLRVILNQAKRAGNVGANAITLIDMGLTVLDVIERFEGTSKRSTENVVPGIDICNFNLLDLNDDNSVTKEELDILIQSTGRVELEELYEKLDQDNDGIVTQEEYMKLYEDVCSGDLEGANTLQKDE
ncbi:uncharacterized protein LOC134246940 [Saccostrea cucullata]|uniref:uncharacterized protein LOC134246940 n=1 Tax=Saccostrea cuccullata TaxID=36930 RepID=UPI002ED4D171